MRNYVIFGIGIVVFIILMGHSLNGCKCLAEGFKYPPAQSDLTPRPKYVETQVGAALPIPGYKKDQDAFITAIGLMNDKLDIIIDLLNKRNNEKRQL